MEGEGMMMEVGLAVDVPRLLDPPADSDQYAKEWQSRIARAQKHWSKLHKRIKHNRKVVSGLDWKSGDPDSAHFYAHRANLILSTINTQISAMYAKNPEISVVPVYQNADMKLFCKTLATVALRAWEDAEMKDRMKATVRAAMTSYFGVIKVMYQREYGKDPIILKRIEDAQENIASIQRLMAQLEDGDMIREQEAVVSELENSIAALMEQVEVVEAEGLVIDRILTENILIDPACLEFSDYADADWIAQLVPMKRSDAEAEFGYKLEKATTYGGSNEAAQETTGWRRGFGTRDTSSEDALIRVIEIWDKKTQRVYTMAEGCDYWLREPYSPKKVGERFHPFFMLPFSLVDGEFIGPSLVDLTERLQEEHNEARDKFNAHRDLVKPGYIANRGEVDRKTIESFAHSELGEITLVDVGGMPLNQVMMPRQHPPFDLAAYDTSAVRQDWEMVTGLQDAQRGGVIEAKTATEARIQQQGLSARVAEFRDKIEDVLSEAADYTCQILVMEMTPDQVKRIMGEDKMEPVIDPATGIPVIDPATMQPAMQVVEKRSEWPLLDRKEVYDMVSVSIRAGTTGEPNRLESQETMAKLLPVIRPLIQMIMQIQMQGMDASPFENLLREVVSRFDDGIDVDSIMPQMQAQQQPAQIPNQHITQQQQQQMMPQQF